MTTFGITVEIADVEKMLDGIGDHCEAAARPAAQAGAQVLYDGVKRNVAAIKRHTGNLASSIYQVYSAKESGRGLASYHISWNTKKAPHAWLVEFGHLQRYEVSYDPKTKRFTTHKDRPLPTPKHVAARPFMRPARALLPQARQAMRDRYIAELRQRGVLK